MRSVRLTSKMAAMSLRRPDFGVYFPLSHSLIEEELFRPKRLASSNCSIFFFSRRYFKLVAKNVFFSDISILLYFYIGYDTTNQAKSKDLEKEVGKVR